MNRPTFDEWFLDGAYWASKRSGCIRRKVGALLVDPINHDIIEPGYNSAPSGELDCFEGGCPRAFSSVPPGSSYDSGPGTCIAIHAEANALLRAGRRARGAHLYLTDAPCAGCLKLAKGAGVAKIIWPGNELMLT